MSKLLCLLATVSILVFPLPQVESQEDSRSSSDSWSTSDGNTTSIDPATFCSMVFNRIGPFCQFVVSDNGQCLEKFSDTTCDACRNILNSCGTFDGDICLSSLASSCPQSEEFLMDYCSVVDGTYMGSGVVNDIRDSKESSGDGLSGCGDSGPVTGFSGSGSTSGDGETGPTGLSGSGGSGEPQFPLGSGSVIDNGDTGPSPSTAPLSPLVSRASLTAQQGENIVTIGFIGINEQQFVEIGVMVFREQVANIVNMNFSSNQLTKRQQPLYSPEDIFVVDSLNVVLIEGDFVLLIEFVVGGQGQSSLVRGSDMAYLLMVEGSRLAMVLSNAIGSEVEFYGVIGLELPTTLVLPSDVSAPNEALESQLSGNFVIGVVVGVSVISFMVVASIMAITTAICIRKKRKRKTATATYVEVSANDGNSFDTNWQPMTVNDYTAVSSTLWTKSEQESDNSTMSLI